MKSPDETTNSGILLDSEEQTTEPLVGNLRRLPVEESSSLGMNTDESMKDHSLRTII